MVRERSSFIGQAGLGVGSHLSKPCRPEAGGEDGSPKEHLDAVKDKSNCCSFHKKLTHTTPCYKFFRGEVWSRGLDYPRANSRSHLVEASGGALISCLENHGHSWAEEETAAEGGVLRVMESTCPWRGPKRSFRDENTGLYKLCVSAIYCCLMIPKCSGLKQQPFCSRSGACKWAG